MTLTGMTPDGKKRQVDLQYQVTNWSTPLKSDDKARGFNNDGKASEPIHSQVRNWDTPTTLLASIRSEAGMDNTLAADVARWSTPVASPNANRTLKDPPSVVAGKHGGHLTAEVLNWSSPRASDGPNGGPNMAGSKGDQPLPSQVLNWGTPTASTTAKGTTAKGTTVHSEMLAHGHLVAQVEEFEDTQNKDHRLNSDWEETLMGWEIGWTDPTHPCAGVFPGFPMGQGYEQYTYEPPRTVHKDASPGRTKRIGMIGNGVVRIQAEAAFYFLLTNGMSVKESN